MQSLDWLASCGVAWNGGDGGFEDVVTNAFRIGCCGPQAILCKISTASCKSCTRTHMLALLDLLSASS